MAKLWYALAGDILRIVATEAEEAQFGTPSDAAGSVTFDTDTNADALHALVRDTNAYRVVAGVVQRNGSPVPIAPDAPETVDRRQFLAGAAQAVQENAAFLALPNPNAAQTTAQVKALTRQIQYLVKYTARQERDRA